MDYTETEVEEMRRAFKMVTTKNDWKAPIVAFIRKRDLEITKKAVEFYTATSCEVMEETDSYVKIVADGYRMGPAGDH